MKKEYKEFLEAEYACKALAYGLYWICLPKWKQLWLRAKKLAGKKVKEFIYGKN